ncbi:MAG: AbrB/MazE/SpoVT family DNA-binding domain-containing protein [Proteobacteria bacterium]|nr:AbrB/MazE/SpoVT family DNA-binding domain-containing protein [Pseudomonadota bacterium]
MRARVSKWGNSLAIRLPKAAVESLRVQEGETVEVTIEGDAFIIRSASPRYRLEDLVAGITPDNQPETIEFPPVGEELL